MSSGCFGRFGMDQPFLGYAPYFASPSVNHLHLGYMRPRVVPMFMTGIPQTDAGPVQKSSKSFTIDDILRRPHPSTCVAGHSCLSGVGGTTDRVDYGVFGHRPPYWGSEMWHSTAQERFTGKRQYKLHLMT